MDSKIKMTQTQCNSKRKTIKKLKIILKTKIKQQELKVLELKSLQTTQNTNNKKPKLMIPHDMIPIARYR